MQLQTDPPALRERAQYIPEIQGLRTVAAVLVAVYHVWFDRVSGGVDIFFVVSGFLITGSIVRQMSGGHFRMGRYLRRIAHRIVPSAYLVVLLTGVATLLLISQLQWLPIGRQLGAAVLYAANIEFAQTSVDYLAQDDGPSPVLHFWALSIQGQFYALWPWLILCFGFLAKRRGQPIDRTVLRGLILVFAASLAYSMYATSTDQARAYFSTSARVWEFALGGIVAMTAHQVRISRRVAAALGTAAIVVILSTGAMIDVARLFPGYAALLPTLSAAAILVAAAGGRAGGAMRVLASRPMVAFGDASYAYFLIHWPLLVFTLAWLETDRLSPSQGLVLLTVSFPLAVAITRFWEARFRLGDDAGAPTSRRLLVLGLLTATLVALILWLGRSPSLPALDSPIGDGDYPGAMLLSEPGVSLDDLTVEGVSIIPPPLDARNDRPSPYDDGCHQTQESDDVLVCEYGTPNSDLRVALVGGSHSTHWHPALEVIALERGWTLLNVTKSACRFGLGQDLADTCETWNEALPDVLAAEGVDVVVTTATTGRSRANERIEPAFVRQWERLAERDILVVALRDNPWWDLQVPECVHDFGPNADECTLNRSDVLRDEAPWDAEPPSWPENVTFIDLSDYFCIDGSCPSVIGNIMVYRDSHHISVPYALSLAPILDVKLRAARPELFVVSSR